MGLLICGLATSLEGGCGSSGAIDPVVPADYRALFTEVRSCRPTVQHGNLELDNGIVAYVRVLTSPNAAQPYLENAAPLPVGGIIVKEGYSDASCRALTLITAMRKEQPGFDAQDGDWQWQALTPELRVTDTAKTSCIICHTDCRARDHMCAAQ